MVIKLARHIDQTRRRRWHPTPVLLPGKSHGWRSLVGCSPWGCKESDTTERLPLSCIGEGNGNPLQCSCLEDPRDGGAWWAAVYGVAQSWTRLKRLSSGSSSSTNSWFCLCYWWDYNDSKYCEFFILHNEMCQHWKIYIIQWNNIFQMTKA